MTTAVDMFQIFDKFYVVFTKSNITITFNIGQ